VLFFLFFLKKKTHEKVVNVKSAQGGDAPSKEELMALQIAKDAIMSPKPPVEAVESPSEKKVKKFSLLLLFLFKLMTGTKKHVAEVAWSRQGIEQEARIEKIRLNKERVTVSLLSKSSKLIVETLPPQTLCHTPSFFLL
jgi:hypothetical protein